MPFCPSCEAEYRESVRVCPTCNTALVPSLSPQGSTEDMVDVYLCNDQQLAERVVELLRGAGLGPLVRDRSSFAFPTTIGTTSERRIAVAAAAAERARSLLQDAIDDGAIAPEEGEVL